MSNLLKRLDANPLITPDVIGPSRPDFEVVCTLNPAAIRVGEETLLLVRVGERPIAEAGEVATVLFDADAGEPKIIRLRRDDPDLDARDPRAVTYKGEGLLTSLSHIRVARSRDGIHFRFDPSPAIFPSEPSEAYGCEDPRVVCLDGRYYVQYVIASTLGVGTSLAVTDDFRTFQKLGIIFPPPWNKDVAIFPEKVGGSYVCRHRPYKGYLNRPSIWTAYSPDLLCWGRHGATLSPKPGTWQGERVGSGAPPIRTDAGWLDIYHGADESGRYCLGAMLTDLERPERLICHSSRPVLEPQADYERTGFYGNCVFSNGLVALPDGTLTVYYGAADRICAAAVTTVEEMIAAARDEL